MKKKKNNNNMKLLSNRDAKTKFTFLPGLMIHKLKLIHIYPTKNKNGAFLQTIIVEKEHLRVPEYGANHGNSGDESLTVRPRIAPELKQPLGTKRNKNK